MVGATGGGDPRCRRQGGREWELADEALGMRGVRRSQHCGALRLARLGETVMDVVRRMQAEAAVVMDGIVPRDERGPVRLRILEGAETRGETGAVFERLEVYSEYGLSLDTWGREWDLVTPRSAMRNATGFEVIAAP